ncbi:MAG: PilZ domain-containing protein [Candidatus Omnitrophica bacterium]|nr:PilZ domain-containing protein [Candidatus Omnitrophota bacterium]MBU4479032.1 PilZ domain-containing protein [Candidatus Omnitrophota bacterium]MCG2703048.1 PilZ domain-containing protein [Candidatus Omnitrophota bacterium]
MVRKKNIERRVCRRFVAELPLELITPEFKIKTSTRNISISGVYCGIDKFIPVGTKCRIAVEIEVRQNKYKQPVKKKIYCAGEIVRIVPAQKRKDRGFYTAGIVFSDIEPADQEVLAQFVHLKNLKEAKELKKMYLRLKDMAARLVEVEECHPTAEHFRKVIFRAIEELDAAAHILDYEINELKNLE